MKWKNTQIQWLKTMFVVSLCTIWLLQTPISTSADWEEDFTEISEWDLTAFDIAWPASNTPSVEYNSSWQIVDGMLVSTGLGEIEGNPTDLACRNETTQSGTWEIDIEGDGSLWLVNDWNLRQPRRDTGIEVRLEDGIGIDAFWKDGTVEGGINGDSKHKQISTSGTHRYKIIKNETFVAAFMDDEYMVSMDLSTVSDRIRHIETICLSGYGGYTTYDNLVVGEGEINFQFPETSATKTEPIKNDQPISPWLLGIGIGIAVISFGTFSYSRYLKKKRIRQEYRLNGKFPSKVYNSIKQTFANKLTLYNLLVGIKGTSDTSLNEKIKKLAPPELFNYRFLLQPVRLSIMKIIYKNLRLPSVEIKNQLGLEWVEYSNNTRALEEKGFIKTRTEVSEEGVQQIVYLEPKGRGKFKKLLELLNQFIASAEKYDDLLDSFSSDDLYPKY